MKIPKKICVKREIDYHTHHVGKYPNGDQFFGYVLDVWPQYYAMLFLFHPNGVYYDTKYYSEIASKDIKKLDALKNQMWEKLDELVNDLGTPIYCDINVELFKVTIDNNDFGLIFNNRSVHLMPGSCIAFNYPWDGYYDT